MACRVISGLEGYSSMRQPGFSVSEARSSRGRRRQGEGEGWVGVLAHWETGSHVLGKVWSARARADERFSPLVQKVHHGSANIHSCRRRAPRALGTRSTRQLTLPGGNTPLTSWPCCRNQQEKLPIGGAGPLLLSATDGGPVLALLYILSARVQAGLHLWPALLMGLGRPGRKRAE